MGMLFFLSAPLFSRNKSNLCPNLCPSDQVYHQAEYSDAMPLELAVDFCLPFPLTSSYTSRLPDDMWKMTIEAAMVKSGWAA